MYSVFPRFSFPRVNVLLYVDLRDMMRREKQEGKKVSKDQILFFENVFKKLRKS